jgi:lantibiotic modifying enzyme
VSDHTHTQTDGGVETDEHAHTDPRDGHPVTTAPADTDRLRTAAREIAAGVDDALVDLPDGGQGATGFVAGERGVHLKAQPGLYCGHLGVAVALAAVDHAVPAASLGDRIDEWAQPLTASLDTVRDRQHVGAGTGFGSTVYGLTLLAALTGDTNYAERRDAVVDAFDPDVIGDDRQYDVLLGSAGTLHGLLACHETTGSAAALSAARACGDHLLDGRYEKWNAYGLYGVAGIAHALYRLWGHTDEPAYREAAADAVAFENTFYADRERNWKMNFGGVRHYTDWWCSGRTGVGAARVGSLAAYDDDPAAATPASDASAPGDDGAATLARDLDRVAAGIGPRLLDHDSLCHGTAGVIDLLVDLAAHPAVGDDAAARLAAGLLDRRAETGHLQVTHGEIPELRNPVLFLGTSGVAYALARTLAPSLPSVLRFAAPTEVET